MRKARGTGPFVWYATALAVVAAGPWFAVSGASAASPELTSGARLAWEQPARTQADLDALSFRLLVDNVDQGDLSGVVCGGFRPIRQQGSCAADLPPLEAAACGTPLVVTAGGPTDDYADPAFALKIASRPAHYPRFGGGLAPDLDSLIDCMERLVSGRASQIDMSRGAALVRDRHSWARVADRLVALF